MQITREVSFEVAPSELGALFGEMNSTDQAEFLCGMARSFVAMGEAYKQQTQATWIESALRNDDGRRKVVGFLRMLLETIDGDAPKES